MKIKNRINGSFLITFFTAILAMGVAVDIYTSNLVKKNIYTALQANNVSRAEHIRTFIQDKETTAVILAAASVYRDFLKEPTESDQYGIIKKKIDDRFVRTMEADPQIRESFILDRNGKVVASSDKTQEGVDQSANEYFLQSKETVHLKDIYYSPVTKALNYTISSPIKDDDGTLLGISVLRYSPVDLFSILKNGNGLGTTGDTEETLLVNKDQYFVSPSIFSGDNIILKQKADAANTGACFDAQTREYVMKNGYRDIESVLGSQLLPAKDYRGASVIGTYAYIPETQWCLITKADSADLLAYRPAMILTIVLIFSCGLLIFLLIGYALSKKITDPIQALREETEKVIRSNDGHSESQHSSDEIEDLSRAFDAMILSMKKSREEIDRKVEEQTVELNTRAKQSDNQKKAILNILEDAEEEKKKVERATQRLELATRSAEIGVWEWDVVKNILVWDDQMYALYGIKKSDFSGAYDAWQKGLHPDDRKAGDEAIQSALRAEKDFNLIFRVLWPNGEVRYIRAYAIVERDADGQPLRMIGVNFDVTHEREVDIEKTEFVSLASHQLKTPVGALSWNLEMLLSGDYGKISKKQKEIISEMYLMNQRMNELINSLLNVSRIEMGVFIIDPTPTDFGKLCDEVLLELESRIRAKGHRVSRKYDKGLTEIPADLKLLRIIFQNYISNAIKYTPDHGKIGIVIKKQDQDVVISVSNNGAPVPEKDKAKIFGKLFRASNAQEQDPDGNGLGLYIVKKIAENGGGKAWFESESGKDTIFYASFPLSGMVRKDGTRQLAYDILE